MILKIFWHFLDMIVMVDIFISLGPYGTVYPSHVPGEVSVC